MPFQVGQEITASVAIVNSAGVPTDPVNVYAFTRSPTQPYGTGTQIAVIRTGTGAYSASFSPPASGTWALWFCDSLTMLTAPQNNDFYAPTSFVVFPPS